jgi:hypothetical protein
LLGALLLLANLLLKVTAVLGFVADGLLVLWVDVVTV